MEASDASWCEDLYRAKARELILYGRALGLGHSEAEDVLHEVFLGLLKLPDPPLQPWRYCVRAYRNRALNRHRGLWRRLVRELESKRWFERSPDETPRETSMMAALARLPPAQREVIVLKIWHGSTFEEIAALLDESPNTVAGRYRYGLQKLRNHLTSQDYGSLDNAGDAIEFLDATGSVGASD